MAAILLGLFNIAAIVGWNLAAKVPCQNGDCSGTGYAEAFVGALWVLGDVLLVLMLAVMYAYRPRTCWRCGAVGRRNICTTCGADVRKAATMTAPVASADTTGHHAIANGARSTPEREADAEVQEMNRDEAETGEVSDEEAYNSEGTEVKEIRPAGRKRVSFAKAMLVFNLIAFGLVLVATVFTFGLILVFAWPMVLGALVLGNVVVGLVFAGGRFARWLRAEDVLGEDSETPSMSD